MINGLLKIDEDLFDIAHRLKEVDDRYELYFNRRKARFEIHADGALQLAVPYDRLDARTIQLAKSTRLEYAENLLASIERENEAIKRKENLVATEKILQEVERVL